MPHILTVTATVGALQLFASVRGAFAVVMWVQFKSLLFGAKSVFPQGGFSVLFNHSSSLSC